MSRQVPIVPHKVCFASVNSYRNCWKSDSSMSMSSIVRLPITRRYLAWQLAPPADEAQQERGPQRFLVLRLGQRIPCWSVHDGDLQPTREGFPQRVRCLIRILDPVCIPDAVSMMFRTVIVFFSPLFCSFNFQKLTSIEIELSMLLKITLKCLSLRVVLDLLNQILNVDAM